jgi:hypothetical protein
VKITASHLLLFLCVVALWCPLTVMGADMWSEPEVPPQIKMEMPPVPRDWHTETGPYVQIHGPSDLEAWVVRLARRAATSFPEFAGRLQLPLPYYKDAQGSRAYVAVYLVETDEQFQDFQPGKAPVWADGVAYSASGLILLRSPKLRDGTAKPLEQVLDHELIHVLIGRAFAPHHPPRWLQEGIAQVFSGEYSPAMSQQLTMGQLGSPLFSLEELTSGFPRDAVRARLAYAQSADFIQWFVGTFGDEALQTVIKDMSQGMHVRGAIRRSTGESFDALSKRWERRFHTGLPLNIRQCTTSDSWWAAGGLLLILGGFLRRGRFRKRLEEMGAEEAKTDAVLNELLKELASESALDATDDTSVH